MSPSEQIREILNADEAAEFLNVHPATIRALARNGTIPGRKVGKEWRFSRQQLIEWIEGGQCKGNVPPTNLTETLRRLKRAKVNRA